MIPTTNKTIHIKPPATPKAIPKIFLFDDSVDDEPPPPPPFPFDPPVLLEPVDGPTNNEANVSAK